MAVTHPSQINFKVFEEVLLEPKVFDPGLRSKVIHTYN